MQTITITINNPTGLHARPATLFTQTAAKFKSKIMIKKGDKAVDAKSILKLLTLAVKQGSEITLTADGEDETQALTALTELIASNFGE